MNHCYEPMNCEDNDVLLIIYTGIHTILAVSPGGPPGKMCQAIKMCTALRIRAPFLILNDGRVE